MKIRDRIKEFRRVPAADLLPSPRNWRSHPKAQANALRGILAEVGFAGAVLARETPDGLTLCDGHLRVETMGDQPVPVLVLDLDEAEADLLLATFDPLSQMAGADAAALESLMASISTGSEALQAMLSNLAEANGIIPETEAPQDFPTLDENLPTDHQCPSCGYKWSGNS